MPLTATEQYFLELVNRARLDPLAEARRYGIDLNQNLAAGTISGAAKQVLASDDDLQEAAAAHSTWMLNTDIFSHTGSGGSDPGDRMRAAGYTFTGSWTWGENIAWSGTTGTLDLEASIDAHHRGLFLSSGHRTNIMGTAFRELGIAQEQGQFTTSNGTTYNASMATQNFALSGTAVFLTGVAYTDSDGDHFYSVGEAVAGTRFAIGAASSLTEAAGGYSLATTAAAGVQVTITQVGSAPVSVVAVDLNAGNVKLDLVGGGTVLSSGNLRLISGVADARLLGVADLTLTGNAADNDLTGNAGNNTIWAGAGDDALLGGSGDDILQGGAGNDAAEGGAGRDQLVGGDGTDRLSGGDAADVLSGGSGADVIAGQSGADRLDGGTGNDTLSGGAGNDSFVFRIGYDHDKIRGFSAAQADRLVLDATLWDDVAMTAAAVVSAFATVTAGSTVLNFGDGDILTLIQFSDLAALDDRIAFI